jgi:hypothetical protein
MVPGGMAAQQSDDTSKSDASSGGAISRSISDSTLRRAALHLNLNNQSVLPSFTSLQQFKVEGREGQSSHLALTNTNPNLFACVRFFKICDWKLNFLRAYNLSFVCD